MWPTLMVCLAAACDPEPPPRTLDLPPRSSGALGGENLAAQLGALDLADREERIYQEIVTGNVPSWMREFRAVRMDRVVDGKEHRIWFWATPDYLSVGNDEDYLLVPLSPQTAQRLADAVNASLPTAAMVDEAWRSADARLAPQRISPQDSVQSVRTMAFFSRHTSMIRAQMMLKHMRAGAFVAGHKKDVVLTSELAPDTEWVAVYGMHGTNGRPSQGLSTAGRGDWVYYNQGVRLVDRRVLVDGVERDLLEVLQDPEDAVLLGLPGPLETPRYPTQLAIDGTPLDIP